MHCTIATQLLSKWRYNWRFNDYLKLSGRYLSDDLREVGATRRKSVTYNQCDARPTVTFPATGITSL